MAENERRILTSEDVQSIPEGGVLDVAPGTIFTDLAREWIEKRKVRVIERSETALRNPSSWAPFHVIGSH